jgi:2-iminobutanoate/2-iminopropanoate deaminase
MKKVVVTDKAPAAIGPYSQGVWAGSFLFLSGQIPLDPVKGALVGTTAAEQAEQVFRNIEGALESQGLTFGNVVKATVFAKNMEDFGAINEVYATRFSAEPPARSFVEVARLPKDVLVEIEVIAYRP